ncbi:uncharacterized protein HD556DRAFT_1247986 [Suillus plorans]|uniref:Uncharacterized protein n=1 Tax=Suillus plorans TaxID=116603 RepID=A0A9P7ACS1_9AGAM|nr:uncharacterized protein HD556DRAFT_1247986 [Suillus plorans]KAG1786707.1 hypothetical protein HD556DRAFT_1247986 [Suillus plorans]
MAFLGLRKWSTPVHSISLVLTPMAPFLAASAVTFYLVPKMQEMGMYTKDPKNPYGAQIAEEAHH